MGAGAEPTTFSAGMLTSFPSWQDTPLTLLDISQSFNASTTVEITILDVDNRPPWFQPCTKYESGANVICSSSGYTGRVTLNKKEVPMLQQQPK